jgi:muramidase (phage lysozyme)
MVIDDPTVNFIKAREPLYRNSGLSYPGRAADQLQQFAILPSQISEPAPITLDLAKNTRDEIGYAVEKKQPVSIYCTKLDQGAGAPEIPPQVTNALSDKSPYQNFLIVGYQASFSERFSVLPTFTKNFFTFYGKNPPSYSFRITWRNDDVRREFDKFKQLFDAYLRPPIAIENNFMLRIVLNQWFLDGFITDMSSSEEGGNPVLVAGQFNFIVVREVPAGATLPPIPDTPELTSGMTLSPSEMAASISGQTDNALTKTIKPTAINFRSQNANQNYKDFSPFAEQYAAKYNLDPNLVKGIIRAESDFNPLATGKGSTATGLMQMLNGTSKDYLKERGKTLDAFRTDPALQVDIGCNYLSDNRDALIKAGKFTTSNLIASYHDGPNNIIRDGTLSIEAQSTYVPRVTEFTKNFTVDATTRAQASKNYRTQ